MSPNRVNSPSNSSGIVPVGPWRCLAMIRSARLCAFDIRCCQSSIAALNFSALGELDLLRAVQLGVGAEGVVNDGFADVDQLPPQPGVMHRAAVVTGVDNADHGGEELGQVGGAADFLEDAGVLELRLQGDGVGKLPGLHPS